MKAEEFFNRYLYTLEEYDEGGYLGLNEKVGTQMLNEYAEEILKIAAEKAKIKQQKNIVYKIFNVKTNEELFYEIPIDKDSILDCLK